MYRFIVARRIRQIFARINAGDWETMVGSLAPDFTYRFYGDNALGGVRTTPEATRLWWQRLFRLLLGARLEVRDVLVAGWPWHTRVATDLVVRATLPDGTPYENIVNQFVRLRWGRVVQVSTLEDTQRLDRAMRMLAAAGFKEAEAPRITDEARQAEGVRS